MKCIFKRAGRVGRQGMGGWVVGWLVGWVGGCKGLESIFNVMDGLRQEASTSSRPIQSQINLIPLP